MRITFLAPLVITLVSCSLSVTTSTYEDESSCDVYVDQTWPYDGATDAYYRGPIEFRLSDADSSATVFASFDGEQTTSEDGTVITYTPSANLEPDTWYRVELDYCGGTPEIAFQTSGLGNPLADPDKLVGSTFLFDPADARYVLGESAAEFLIGMFGREVLVQVLDSVDDELSLRVAIASDPDEQLGQDTCYRTLDLDGVQVTQTADFSYANDALAFEYYEDTFSLFDVSTGGTIAADISHVGGGSFSASVDLRGITSAMDDADVDEICELLENLGSSCEPCPYMGVSTCVTISGTDLLGMATAIDLQEVTERDSHSECDSD